MLNTIRKFWCDHCYFKTWQTCLPDLQGTYGLVWKCARCSRTAERPAHAARTAERVTESSRRLT